MFEHQIEHQIRNRFLVKKLGHQVEHHKVRKSSKAPFYQYFESCLMVRFRSPAVNEVLEMMVDTAFQAFFIFAKVMQTDASQYLCGFAGFLVDLKCSFHLF